MVFLPNFCLAITAAAAYQHSHALNDVSSIEVENFDGEDVHWEVEYRTETVFPPTRTAYTTVYYTPPNPVTVYATVTSVSVVTQLATVTQFAAVTQYAPPVTVTTTAEPRQPKHAFNGDAIIKHHPQHMNEFSLERPAASPMRKQVFVTTTIMDAPPTPLPRKIVKANVIRAPCGGDAAPEPETTSCSDSASDVSVPDATPCSDPATDVPTPYSTPACPSATTDAPAPDTTPGCSDAPTDIPDATTDVPDTTTDSDSYETTAADQDQDGGDCGCEPPCASISRSRCGQDYEHQYGDDTMDFLLDTKDHTRRRLRNSKERAKKALSHVRPHHIHNRIAQVVHDERPEINIRHERVHGGRRQRNKYSKSNIRHEAGCGCPQEVPVKAPCAPPPVKAPCAPPVKAPAKALCAPPPVKAPCAPPPVKAPCAPPPVKAPCAGEPEEREHQYGDDTMHFMLNTKDHVRSRWGSFKERAKSALSHFTPGHVHDRTSQLLHDERPEMSDDHADLHARKGRRN